MLLKPLASNGQLNQFSETNITLESLIRSCRNRQMRQIKIDVPRYRTNKFTQRGWTIQPTVYEPVIYKSVNTMVQVSRDPAGYLRLVDPRWNTLVPQYRILRLETLTNSAWDSAYLRAVHWINSETQTGPNDRLLYHGTRANAVESIKKFGFDSRYFRPTGLYGRGAYFADTPRKADEYTE